MAKTMALRVNLKFNPSVPSALSPPARKFHASIIYALSSSLSTLFTPVLAFALVSNKHLDHHFPSLSPRSEEENPGFLDKTCERYSNFL